MNMAGVALGRFMGTEVRAHWSWIPVLAIIVVFFGGDLTTGSVGWSSTASWVTAIAIAALAFLSVLAHELAHVAMAARYGLKARVVVIQLLGGPYLMALRPPEPRQELRVAAAGPVLSLVVGAASASLAIGLVAGPVDLNAAPEGIQALWFVAAVMAAFNLFLGLINLVPGYPLDGARMLHAVAWKRTGADTAATHAAVRVGRYVGWAFMLGGLAMLLVDDPISGLGMILAGWLIMGSSRTLEQRAFLQTLVAGIHVRDALDSAPNRIPPQLTLDVFAGPYLGELLGAAALVQRGSDLLGLIGTSQIRRIPRRTWAETRTEQVMVPIDSVPVASADSELWPALEALEQSGLDALVVPTDAGEGEAELALFSRRSAALLVHERAVEEKRRLAARGSKPGRGGFLGRH
jgi:Zn-dependent protease